MRRFSAVTGLFAFILMAGWHVDAGAQTGALQGPSRGLGTWSEKARLPDIRSEAANAFVNGKLYVMGGLARMQEASMLVQEWDPATDMWRDKAPMPGPAQPSERHGAQRQDLRDWRIPAAGARHRADPPLMNTTRRPTAGARWRR